MEKNYLTVTEVAKEFSVSQNTVYRLLEEGRLQFIRVRSAYRISVEEVNRYKKEMINNSKPKI